MTTAKKYKGNTHFVRDVVELIERINENAPVDLNKENTKPLNEIEYQLDIVKTNAYGVSNVGFNKLYMSVIKAAEIIKIESNKIVDAVGN